MLIQQADKPREIFIGPVAVLLTLIKNRSHFQSWLCPKFKGFESDDCISASIIELLFDAQHQDKMTRIILHLHGINRFDAELLQQGYNAAQNLNAHDRIRTIEYINNILQCDLETLEQLKPHLTNLPKLDNLFAWYNQINVQQNLSRITPVAYPQTIEAFKAFKMYSNDAAWEVYKTRCVFDAEHHGPYSYSYSHHHHHHHHGAGISCGCDIGEMTFFGSMRESIFFMFNRPQSQPVPVAEQPKSRFAIKGCVVQ